MQNSPTSDETYGLMLNCCFRFQSIVDATPKLQIQYYLCFIFIWIHMIEVTKVFLEQTIFQGWIDIGI
jgi:hypothetical protein